MLSQTRSGFTLLVLAPLLWILKGKTALSFNRRDALTAISVGVFGIAGSNFFYYYAIQQTTVATAIILQYTAPVLVLLYMLARRIQRPTAPRLMGVSLAVIGSVLAIGIVGKSSVFPWFAIGTSQVKLTGLGVAAALAAAVAFAYYNIAGQKLTLRHDHWGVLVWAMFGASVLWLVINPPWKIVAAHYSGAQWAFMGVFAMFSALVPFGIYFAGLKFLDPTRAIVTSCLEPVFAILVAAIALGETVNGIQILGIVVTLGATVLVQLPEPQKGNAGFVIEPME